MDGSSLRITKFFYVKIRSTENRVVERQRGGRTILPGLGVLKGPLKVSAFQCAEWYLRFRPVGGGGDFHCPRSLLQFAI